MNQDSCKDYAKNGYTDVMRDDASKGPHQGCQTADTRMSEGWMCDKDA
ncbi:hypothetical protein HNR48_001952 [Pseudoteredinibacter isoporae]|uniref:Uncharacterized protein n=1 Tax=Pseudoteredinibacter isoporae TaxID=570281 RepID=A0A7X0JSX6_9GAMM|nr:hypothetical protein [Pseudoteredinibacter isoporae]